MKCQASLTQIPCLMLEKTFCVVLNIFQVQNHHHGIALHTQICYLLFHYGYY